MSKSIHSGSRHLKKSNKSSPNRYKTDINLPQRSKETLVNKKNRLTSVLGFTGIISLLRIT